MKRDACWTMFVKGKKETWDGGDGWGDNATDSEMMLCVLTGTGRLFLYIKLFCN